MAPLFLLMTRVGNRSTSVATSEWFGEYSHVTTFCSWLLPGPKFRVPERKLMVSYTAQLRKCDVVDSRPM